MLVTFFHLTITVVPSGTYNEICEIDFGAFFLFKVTYLYDNHMLSVSSMVRTLTEPVKKDEDKKNIYENIKKMKRTRYCFDKLKECMTHLCMN